MAIAVAVAIVHLVIATYKRTEKANGMATQLRMVVSPFWYTCI